MSMRVLHKIRSAFSSPDAKPRLFAALREKFREGYGMEDFRSDLMSGIVVGMIAIPLGMALAIASGVSPQYGLYTVIIAGGLVALLGGSRFQVTGPTAAFVVILAPIVQKFGFGGLLLSGLMAGFMLILMGVTRMGSLIRYIPYPVMTGFTAGIGVVIATLQLKDLFGLRVQEMPERFHAKIMALYEARSTFSFVELSMGLTTLALLLLWPKVNNRIPAPLVVLSAISIGTILLKALIPDLEIATIGERFSYEMNGVKGDGIPRMLPRIDWPWNFVDSDGRGFTVNMSMIKAILPGAFAIAMLGAIESLLSAMVADRLAKTKHNPDAELLALGVGNIVCPFFGGVPATGAIARTATNIRFGARSPISAIIHAIFVLLVILVFAPYVSYLPMTALAALLIFVAYNMSEPTKFAHILRVAPRTDVIVLLACFSFTVLFDMVIGVAVGVVLAALFFMRRMVEETVGRKIHSHFHPLLIDRKAQRDIAVYEIKGPFFFGVAQKTAEDLPDIPDDTRGVVFLMNEIPMMDVTGLVAFEDVLRNLSANRRRKVCLVGLRSQPKELIHKSRVAMRECDVLITESVDKAFEAIGQRPKGEREESPPLLFT